MIPRPPRSTRTDTPFPYTTRVRSTQRVQTILDFLTARDDVRLLGPRDAQARTATIAFVPVTRTPAEIASELGEHGIMIGSGHFSSVRLCEALGIDPARPRPHFSRPLQHAGSPPTPAAQRKSGT